MHSRWFAGGQIAKMPGGAEYSSSKRQRMGLSQQSVVAATKDQGSCNLGAEAAIRRDEAAGVLWAGLPRPSSPPLDRSARIACPFTRLPKSRRRIIGVVRLGLFRHPKVSGRRAQTFVGT